MKKKVLSLVLALTMACGMAPAVGGEEVQAAAAAAQAAPVVVDMGTEDSSTPALLGEEGESNTGKIVEGPQIAYNDNGTSVSMTKCTVAFDVTGVFRYYINEEETETIYKKTVKLYKDNKLIKTQTCEGYNSLVKFANIPITYNKKHSFKAQLFVTVGETEISGPTAGCSIRSARMGKNQVAATKLSAKSAIVRWGGAQGATGYQVYQGSKLVKTTGKNARQVTINRSGAGKAKFKVLPILKSGGKTYKGTSSVATPKANQVTFSRSISYRSYPYQTCRFVVTKVTLSGSTYKVTGYACNNRIFPMQKYTKLTLNMTVDKKKAFSKTYKNLKVNAKKESSKKLVLKIKGKKAMDLANGAVSLSISEKPKWKM